MVNPIAAIVVAPVAQAARVPDRLHVDVVFQGKPMTRRVELGHGMGTVMSGLSPRRNALRGALNSEWRRSGTPERNRARDEEAEERAI
jgi:hypothetical protein